MKKRFLGLTAAMLVAVMALTGCTSAPTEPEQPENSTAPEVSAPAETAEYPIVIKHALGETVIETKPERVAAIGARNEDAMLSLGAAPVGISMNWYGVTDDSGLMPWTVDALKAIGATTEVYNDLDGLDFEAISNSEPDLILATYSGITAEDYELLTQIAPTVAYPTTPWMTDWRSNTLTNATAVGMAAEGEALVAELEELISAEAAKYPAISGKSAAFLSVDVSDLSTFWLYLPGDSRVDHMTDFGFTMPESVKKIGEGTTDFAIQFSAENVEQLSDIDVIVLYGDESTLEALQADKLMGTIPAIQRGSVALIADNTPMAAASTPSALSIPACAAGMAELFGAAAEKVAE